VLLIWWSTKPGEDHKRNATEIDSLLRPKFSNDTFDSILAAKTLVVSHTMALLHATMSPALDHLQPGQVAQWLATVTDENAFEEQRWARFKRIHAQIFFEFAQAISESETLKGVLQNGLQATKSMPKNPAFAKLWQEYQQRAESIFAGSEAETASRHADWRSWILPQA
jgi:maltose-binding protein MalE